MEGGLRGVKIEDRMENGDESVRVICEYTSTGNKGGMYSPAADERDVTRIVGRTGQVWTKQDRTGQSKTGQDN